MRQYLLRQLVIRWAYLSQWVSYSWWWWTFHFSVVMCLCHLIIHLYTIKMNIEFNHLFSISRFYLNLQYYLREENNEILGMSVGRTLQNYKYLVSLSLFSYQMSILLTMSVVWLMMIEQHAQNHKDGFNLYQIECFHLKISTFSGQKIEIFHKLWGPRLQSKKLETEKVQFYDYCIYLLFNIIGLLNIFYWDMTFCTGAKALAITVLMKIPLLSLELRS